jgi:hypothetical protein
MKDEVVYGYYFSNESSIFKKCYKSCGRCTGPGDIRNPNCTDCKDLDTNCQPCNDFIHNDSCVKECPPHSAYDSATRICHDCKENEFVFRNTCVDHCPDGWTKKDDNCLSCLEAGKFFYKDKCLDACPEHFVADSLNTCIELDLDFESNKIIIILDHVKNGCNPNPCKMDGKCSTKFELINCDCPTGYTGIFCQLNETDDVNAYISNNLF